MAKLIYSALCSLDGFIEDDHGDFSWAAPDEEVHAFVNERMRTIGTHLYGRRLYDVMKFWNAIPDDTPTVYRDFAAIWQAADKIVYTRTLGDVPTAHTRIVTELVPEAVQALKDGGREDLLIGGAELAGHAFAAGLIDEVQLYLFPIVVGRGKRALPDRRLELALVDERRFSGGTVYVRYARGAGPR
jgi:dihydrofolate reductase